MYFEPHPFLGKEWNPFSVRPKFDLLLPHIAGELLLVDLAADGRLEGRIPRVQCFGLPDGRLPV